VDVVAERQRILDRIAAIKDRLLELYRMRDELRQSAAQDRARARPAAAPRVVAAQDIEITIDGPRMQDALGDWYRRLP
jgi:hypothetical protein